MPAVLRGDPGTVNAGTTRFAIVAKVSRFLQVINEAVGPVEWPSTDRTPFAPTGFTALGGPGTLYGSILEATEPRNNPTETAYEVWYKLSAGSNWSLGVTVPMESDYNTSYTVTNLPPETYDITVRAVIGIWKSLFFHIPHNDINVS